MAYLDHNATSPPLEDVIDQMMGWMRTHAGNPSSLHGDGVKARQILDLARARVAHLVGAKPSEVIFTSGATEANVMALAHLATPGGRLVAVATEHPAVLAPLEALGVSTTLVPVDRRGQVDLAQLEAALEGASGLALMGANNETGVLHDLDAVADLVQRSGVPWHCDAVQLARWAPPSLASGYGRAISSLALSAHKLGGPQGAGALVVRGGAVRPLLRGGGQEGGRRAGTPAVAAMGGFGLAASLAPVDGGLVAGRRDRLEGALALALPGLVVYGAEGPRLPNTSFVAVPESGGWADGEWLTLGLAERGVSVSTGAACASGEARPSHVLTAMGYEARQVQGSLRFSLGPMTTDAEVDAAVTALQEVLAEG
jgi:cysteine desulfurase